MFQKWEFFQYFEGEKSCIDKLYQKIQNDNRHHHVKTLAQGSIAIPLFKEWNMHCFNFNKDDHESEISEAFCDFKIYSWQEDDVEKVVGDVKRYYASHAFYNDSKQFEPQAVSYITLRSQPRVKQHYFLLWFKVF